MIVGLFINPQWDDWLPGESGERGLAISVQYAAGYDPEGYSLEVDADGVIITATAAAGAFHGLTTLRWMLPPDSENAGPWSLPMGSISDSPRFETPRLASGLLSPFHGAGLCEAHH
jgi:hypothetical protein